MKKIIIYSLLSLFAFILVGCSDDDNNDESIILFSSSEIAIEGNSSSQATVEFNINSNWTADISYESDEKEWLSINTAKGKSGYIRLNIISLTDAPIDGRRAYLNIHYSGKTQSILIIQGIGPEVDITAKFDPNFAKVLEYVGVISNRNVIKMKDVSKEKLLYLYTYQSSIELTSLAGIEYFEALEGLGFSTTKITQIDLSKNKNLLKLLINNNSLESLDISQNKRLKILAFDNNPGKNNKFIIKSWFDNSHIPNGFPISIAYNNATMPIDYQKVN